MLFKHAAQGDERAYMTIFNCLPQSITTGFPVNLALGTASFNGTNAICNTNGTLSGAGFIGVANRDIPGNSYGIIQTLGMVASVLLSNVGTSLTINIGDPLTPGPAGFFSAAPGWFQGGYKYLIASNLPPAISAQAYCSGYIRAI